MGSVPLLPNPRWSGINCCLQTEAVVKLFRRAWQEQQQAASFCDDEHPDTMGILGRSIHLRPQTGHTFERGLVVGLVVQGPFVFPHRISPQAFALVNAA